MTTARYGLTEHFRELPFLPSDPALFRLPRIPKLVSESVELSLTDRRALLASNSIRTVACRRVVADDTVLEIFVEDERGMLPRSVPDQRMRKLPRVREVEPEQSRFLIPLAKDQIFGFSLGHLSITQPKT